MFGTFLLLAVALMELYVFWRIASVPWIKSRLSWRGLVILAVLLWGLFWVGRMAGHGNGGGLAIALELAGMTWLGTLFLIFACVLAADLLSGFGFFFSWAPRLRGMALLVGLVLAVIALVQGLRSPVIEEYEIGLPGLPPGLNGFKLVMVADTHLGALLGRSWMEEVVKQVDAQAPDVILLLGDIVEGHGNDPDELVPVLKKLSAPLGVWMVLGNHESYGRSEVTRRILDQAGINLLRNSHIELAPGLVLAGIDYRGRWHGGVRELGEDMRLEQALEGKPEGLVILLSHAPTKAKKASAAGVDLMLSGHTHGGQIWPWGYLVRIRHPQASGQYEVEGMPIVVTRGAGTWGPRMRLWKPGEISVITLRPGS